VSVAGAAGKPAMRRIDAAPLENFSDFLAKLNGLLGLGVPPSAPDGSGRRLDAETVSLRYWPEGQAAALAPEGAQPLAGVCAKARTVTPAPSLKLSDDALMREFFNPSARRGPMSVSLVYSYV